MTQTMSIRIDSDAREGMSKVCEELGISVSVAINMFAKKVAREKRIPFELEVDPFYSKKNMEYLLKLKKEYDKGNLKIVEHNLIEN